MDALSLSIQALNLEPPNAVLLRRFPDALRAVHAMGLAALPLRQGRQGRQGLDARDARDAQTPQAASACGDQKQMQRWARLVRRNGSSAAIDVLFHTDSSIGRKM